MNQRNLLADQSVRKALADRLSKCSKVKKFDKDDEKEAEVLAHAFGDLEESFRVVLDEQLPKLMDEKASSAEVFDALLEIGEEFRHILYHIKESRFYRYLDNQRCNGES